MQVRSISEWIDLLGRVAATVPAEIAAEIPRLGAGPLDEPFALAAGAATGGGAPIPAPDPLPGGELGLWWAMVDESVDVDSLIAPPADAPDQGSLLPQGMYRTIEVWTEADLCGLHALWSLAHRRHRSDWMERVQRVRDWHLVNTQPDNATNRPWALHVFVLAGTAECTHYAETLLHNSMIMSGKPDVLSAWILRDAAKQLASANEGHVH